MQNQTTKQNNTEKEFNVSAVLTCTTYNSEAQTEEQELPWVGSYFGVPHPAYRSKPLAAKFQEAEIHILLKDMGVARYTIQEESQFARVEGSRATATQIGIGDPQDLGVPLLEIAWKNPDAIAFAVHYFLVDPQTGKREKNPWPGTVLMLKIGNFEWQWVEKDGKRGHRFVPEVVKSRHPHVFS